METPLERVMSTEVTSVEPECGVLEAARLMAEASISCVVVCADGRPVGVVSERDLTRIVASGAKLEDICARDVMRAQVVTASPADTVAKATQLLDENQVRRLVVVDAGGQTKGIVTQSDLIRAQVGELAEHRDQLEKLVGERTAELEEANRKLEALALQDSLMKIGNRRAMEQELVRRDGFHARYKRGYSVILLDVDHFKNYNDSYGHPAGDEVLVKMAEALRASMRACDTVYRYGGEEILVVLPETKYPGAKGAASRLRKTVQELGIEHAESEHGVVTVSAGVADCANGGGWSEVLERADEALYRAKSGGRNTVC